MKLSSTRREFEHSIVLIGNFNPKIFHPAWFAAEDLLGEQEAEGATVEINHPDISIFSTDWLRIEVLHERFIAKTERETHTEALRDIVLGTFSLLRHTPISKMGINMNMHLPMNSVEQWHKAGHTLAPKAIWSDVLENPGMISITMEETERRDKRKGRIRVKVEPSVKIVPGLFFDINDHLEKEPDVQGCLSMMQLLKDIWTESTERSRTMIETLYDRLSA